MSAAVAGTVSDPFRPTRSYTNTRDVTRADAARASEGCPLPAASSHECRGATRGAPVCLAPSFRVLPWSTKMPDLQAFTRHYETRVDKPICFASRRSPVRSRLAPLAESPHIGRFWGGGGWSRIAVRALWKRFGSRHTSPLLTRPEATWKPRSPRSSRHMTTVSSRSGRPWFLARSARVLATTDRRAASASGGCLRHP